MRERTVGERDGGEVKGGVEAGGVEEEGIDVGVGELADEDGEAEVAAVVEEVAEEGGLAAAEEAGDEGAPHPPAAQPRPPVEHPVLERHAHLVPLHPPKNKTIGLRLPPRRSHHSTMPSPSRSKGNGYQSRTPWVGAGRF